jgi:hypothetical protein
VAFSNTSGVAPWLANIGVACLATPAVAQFRRLRPGGVIATQM